MREGVSAVEGGRGEDGLLGGVEQSESPRQGGDPTVDPTVDGLHPVGCPGQTACHVYTVHQFRLLCQQHE